MSTVPNAPTSVTIDETKNYCYGGFVSWTKPTNNGGTPILYYTIKAYDDGNYLPFMDTVIYGEDTTAGFIYGGMSFGYYTVTATNAIGASVESDPSSPGNYQTSLSTAGVYGDAVALNDMSYITNYVDSVSATTDSARTDLAIEMRAAYNGFLVYNRYTNQEQADTKVAYIDSMRTKVGASSFTVPQSRCTDFIYTYVTRVGSVIASKPITAYVPQYTSQSATINLSTASPSNYVHTEIPIGYTIVLQNGAASVSLTYNGSNFVDGSSNTHTTGAALVLGTKTVTLLAIGSGLFDIHDTTQVVCITKGSMIRTPSGDLPVETLRQGDSVITGDGRSVRIRQMKQIVVLAASEQNAPYLIETDAFGKNCPPTCLEVSPRHAIQLPSGLWEIPCEAAKENKRVHQRKDLYGKQVVYYHFSLPNYITDTTIVNGQIIETLNDGTGREHYLWNKEKQGYVRTIKYNNTPATALKL